MDMAQDYLLCFVCPQCWQSAWVLKRNLAMDLEEVLNTCWEFECPIHGPLREKPLNASPRRTFMEGIES